MTIQAKYVHTNIVARDWQSLARFYQNVLGCLPVLPEREYSGKELDRGTGLNGVTLAGIHLRLPGNGEDGPTLEIFQYSPPGDSRERQIHQPGFGHLAFAVSNVREAQEEVLANGGTKIGEVTGLELPTGARVEWCYVADPEGNGIELQTWS